MSEVGGRERYVPSGRRNPISKLDQGKRNEKEGREETKQGKKQRGVGADFLNRSPLSGAGHQRRKTRSERKRVNWEEARRTRTKEKGGREGDGHGSELIR